MSVVLAALGAIVALIAGVLGGRAAVARAKTTGAENERRRRESAAHAAVAQLETQRTEIHARAEQHLAAELAAGPTDQQVADLLDESQR